MSNLIYEACDDAWTTEQQSIRADTLKSVLHLQQVQAESGLVKQTVQQKKAYKAADDANKAAREAEEARRITEEEAKLHKVVY